MNNNNQINLIFSKNKIIIIITLKNKILNRVLEILIYYKIALHIKIIII